MYDCYIFDLDGVLVDVPDSYKREVFNDVGDELGMGFTDEQIQNLWHGMTDSRNEIINSWGFEDEKEFWNVFDKYDTPERRIENTFSYDDVDILGNIHSPIGVVTHSPPELASQSIKKTEISHHIDEVVSCDWETGFKPDPNPVNLCINSLGVDRSSTVMIGDSKSDVAAAWNANISAGHLNRHGYSIEADHKFRSLNELDRIF